MQTDVQIDEANRPADKSPVERMAMIRRLARFAHDAAVSAGKEQVEADQMQPDDPAMWAALDRVDALWTSHDRMVITLLEYLILADDAGDLAVCEAALE